MASESPDRIRCDFATIRCTPELLNETLGEASVVVREFDEETSKLWSRFEETYRGRSGKDEVQAPYSVVSTVLRALYGGYVHFDPKNRVLASMEPIDDVDLLHVITLMSRRALGVPMDDIALDNPPRMAEKMATAPGRILRLADHLKREDNAQPDAANWVYRTVTWELARYLAKHTWNVDGQAVTLRADNTGGLVALANPWANETATAFSVPRVRLTMKTMEHVSDPLILISSQTTRIKDRLAFARKVLVPQADPALPLLEVELDGRGKVRYINAMALSVLARMQMDNAPLRVIHQRSEQERAAYEAATPEEASQLAPIDLLKAPADAPTDLSAGLKGDLFPIQGKTFKFPIGRGVGMHHMRELDKHIRTALGGSTKTLVAHKTALSGFKRPKAKEPVSCAADVVRSVKSMGYERLRIVCLWDRDENRLRMVSALAQAYGIDVFDPVDGASVPLHGDMVTAVFWRAPEFLGHGPAEGRTAIAQQMSVLQRDMSTLVGVWAETDHESVTGEDQSEEEAEQKLTAKEKRASRKKAQEEDGKHLSHRVLATFGLNVQYTSALRQAKPAKGDKQERDYQALMSLQDLYRSLGIIDRRIDAVMRDKIGHHKPTGVARCGIHVRRQSKRPGEKQAKICITASVMVPPTYPDEAWTLHGWSYTAPKWQPYDRAQPAYHALDYPEGKLTAFVDDNAGYKKVAAEIDQALSDLSDYLGRTPYTVTVDAVATRRLWEGLHNRRQGQDSGDSTTWLPGSTLPAKERPIGIVRINVDMNEMPRPVGITHLAADGKVVASQKRTDMLFKVDTDLGAPTWVLVTTPHQFDGSGAGRLGEDKTRWSASHGVKPDKKNGIKGEKNEVAKNWYTMTATGIYPVALAEGVEGEHLVNAAARMATHPLAWANRTKYPIELHAAVQMDKDHPQYRRTAPEQESDFGDPDDEDEQ
ncbi:RNaseH domain-containing protein [Kitasatospora sp. NPDC088783]|uniref:RNaseH domain-containing protein n=1 Tax=Kitasatospora sp. NPDC088783 TaxID=3364077 RepID=UPI0038263C22